MTDTEVSDLTADQFTALAREARRLAGECAKEKFAFDANTWCGCAIGTVMLRAGLVDPPPVKFTSDQIDLAIHLDELLGVDDEGYGPVSHATWSYVRGEHGALVRPLNQLADALAARALSRGSIADVPKAPKEDL